LGTLFDKTERLVKISNYLGTLLNLSVEEKAQLSKAAYLSKADVVTQVVKEFPELQGKLEKSMRVWMVRSSSIYPLKMMMKGSFSTVSCHQALAFSAFPTWEISRLVQTRSKHPGISRAAATPFKCGRVSSA